jgi:hypothetical protein
VDITWCITSTIGYTIPDRLRLKMLIPFYSKTPVTPLKIHRPGFLVVLFPTAAAVVVVAMVEVSRAPPWDSVVH